MPTLEKRGEKWRLSFMYKRRRFSCTLFAQTQLEAETHRADAIIRLRMLKQGLIDLRGSSIENYILYKGNPPAVGWQPQAPDRRDLTVGKLRDLYLASATYRRLEPSTQAMTRSHFVHLMRIFRARQPLIEITQREMQRYVEQRERDRNPPINVETIRKELKTFRTAWNWAMRIESFPEPWPGKYLTFQKGDEQLPFLTIQEAEARIAEGVLPKDAYESIYLLPSEVAEILDHVRASKLPIWVYPMFVMAAHTGARRSEILRATVSDISLEQGRISIREKKRVPGKRSTRTVPLTPLLADALARLLKRPGPLFRGKYGKGLMLTSARKYFHKALRGTRFEQLRGWHTFRHSFISALASAGTDQRIIDDLVGHSTENQRRRYRHLLPNITAAAVLRVFGV